MSKKKNVKRANGYYILRSRFKKNGKTYYAKDYGKKAFKIFIKCK